MIETVNASLTNKILSMDIRISNVSSSLSAITTLQQTDIFFTSISTGSLLNGPSACSPHAIGPGLPCIHPSIHPQQFQYSLRATQQASQFSNLLQIQRRHGNNSCFSDFSNISTGNFCTKSTETQTQTQKHNHIKLPHVCPEILFT